VSVEVNVDLPVYPIPADRLVVLGTATWQVPGIEVLDALGRQCQATFLEDGEYRVDVKFRAY